jgi:hypothetical protein
MFSSLPDDASCMYSTQYTHAARKGEAVWRRRPWLAWPHGAASSLLRTGVPCRFTLDLGRGRGLRPHGLAPSRAGVNAGGTCWLRRETAGILLAPYVRSHVQVQSRLLLMKIRLI